jgi:hypothetical protein
MNELFDESSAGPAVVEVDRLLTAFYQAEMPHPWPRLKLPRERAVRRAVPGLRQLALAASLLLALVAYWGLTGLFSPQGAGILPGDAQHIGSNPLKTHAPVKHLVPMERQRTPAGKDAQLFEEDTPGGVVINVIGPSTSKGPR